MTTPTPTRPLTLPADALLRNDEPDSLVPNNEAIGRLALEPLGHCFAFATSRSNTTSTWRRRRASLPGRA